MKLALVSFLIILGVNPLYVTTANSASYADCVSISSPEVAKSFGNSVYSIQVSDLCDAGIRNYSLTLLSNKYSAPNVTNYYVILYRYSTKVTFSLKGFGPGRYQPALEISSNKDFGKRIISLPEFTIQAPIDCIQLNRSGLDPGNIVQSYSLTLKNVCEELDSYDFSNISMQLMGVAGAQFSYQEIYSLSDYGTNFSFNLSDLTAGDYYPTLYLKDKMNSDSKNIPLMPFTIQKQPKPSATPTKEASAITDLELCSSSKNIKEFCIQAPSWFFEFCTVYEVSQLQQKVGTKWVKRKNFRAELKSESCDETSPNYFAISGVSSSKLTLQFRMLHTATKKYSSNSYNFIVKPKKSN